MGLPLVDRSGSNLHNVIFDLHCDKPCSIESGLQIEPIGNVVYNHRTTSGVILPMNGIYWIPRKCSAHPYENTTNEPTHSTGDISGQDTYLVTRGTSTRAMATSPRMSQVSWVMSSSMATMASLGAPISLYFLPRL